MKEKANGTAKKEKIVFVLDHYYPYLGGAENLFFLLTTGLAKIGFEVVVITTRFDAKLPKEEYHKGVKIVRVGSRNRFVFTLASIPTVFRLARSADVIHTTTYNAALPAALVGAVLRKPVYVTFHEVWGKLWWRLPFISFLEKTAFSLFEKMLLFLPFDKFIAVSDFTKNVLIQEGIPAQKIVRIYNGMEYADFKDYRHRPPDVFTFSFFGRLGISKGLNLLIPAAAAFRKANPDTKFKLIIPTYPKPLFEKIMALIEAHGLAAYIEMHHSLSRAQLFQELLTSSCVAIPSYSEGFCFAATETVALGVPIISSHQGALPETVSGKYIAMEEMTVEALTSALEKAYRNEWTAIPIRRFDLAEAEAQYIALYADKG